jgi:hypothetical protein
MPVMPNAGYSPPAYIIKLTETREITPYVWVHPDDERCGRWAVAPLLRRVQIALKPASKTLGLHGIFIRGMGLKYVIADSTFKRMQVDARAC